MKSDLALRFLRRRHQLPNRIDDRGDFFIVFADTFLEFGEFLRQLAIAFERFAQLHKRAHDRDVHLHRALAFQNAREHRDALFGEGVRDDFAGRPT